MKKIALALSVLCVFAFQLNAQNSSESGRLRFGPVLDMNISTTNLSAAHAPVVGFNAGALVSYGLGSGMYLQSGLLFAQKGVKWTYDGDYCYPGYIDLPINFGYEYAFNENISIFAEAGIYAGVGVSGKYRDGDGYRWDYWDITFLDGGKPNRFEFGIGLHAGVEVLRGLQVRLGYNIGLTKMASSSNSARSFDTFTIGVAYMFL